MARVEHQTGSVKSKVLHAAAKLFLEKGYEKSSIREIADVAGVNRGSLCFAFKDKESIFPSVSSFAELKLNAEKNRTRSTPNNAHSKMLFFIKSFTCTREMLLILLICLHR